MLLASLCCEPPSSVPTSSSVPALSMNLTYRFRHPESDSPSPASTPSKTLISEPNPTPTRTEPKKYVSSPVTTLPSKKRGTEDFGIGEKPVAKRRDWKQRGETPAPRAPRAWGDHWSPPSSRVSSPVRSTAVRISTDRYRPARSTDRYKPVRSTLIPAKKWYSHLKSSPPMNEMDTKCNLKVSASKPPAVQRQEKTEDKKYKTWEETALAKAKDEEKVECYNCGKKGHWFMDCLSGCGKCNGDGHRTIDCGVVKVHVGFKGGE
jgi:hypothetical protein